MPIERLSENLMVYRCPMCGLVKLCERLIWISSQVGEEEYDGMCAIEILDWMTHPASPNHCKRPIGTVP